MRTWAEVGIDESLLRNPHGEQKIPCPRCRPGSRHPERRCLNVNTATGEWHCWNDGGEGCGWKGSLRGPERDFTAPQPGVVAVVNGQRQEWRRISKEEYLKKTEALPPEAFEWLAKRGISRETAVGCGLRWGVVTKDGDRWIKGIFYPYLAHDEQGQVYIANVKKRCLCCKDHMQLMGRDEQDRPCRLVFFGLTNVSDTTVVVEGELDAIAYYQAGIRNVISVPNGATLKSDTAKLDYLENCRAELSVAKHIVLSVDDDEPGRKLSPELARRIGFEKCSYVVYPVGCKDANDVLLEHGPEALHRMIERAKPYPSTGLIRPMDLRETLQGWLKDGMPKGHSTGWKSLDPYFRVVLGQLCIITGIPSHGKALALDTEIVTVDGWTTMGEIKVGDRVFDEQGKPCNVVGVTEVWEDRPCYRLRFSDGSEIVADAEHEWLTRDERARHSARNARKNGRDRRIDLQHRGTDQSHLRTWPAIRTTRKIAETLIHNPGRHQRLNHAVRVADPLDLPERELPLSPYLLGVWLGDGSSAGGQITTADPEILEAFRERRFVVTKHSGPYAYGVTGLKWVLRTVGVLDNKHIPTQYLRASYEQRLALLQGLMDTDGCVTTYGRCEFTNTNERLAHGVFELVATLGWQPTWSEGRATLYGKDCGPKYRVMFTPHGQVFRLERKQCRVQSSPSPRLRHRTIVSCEPVESVPVRCIQVDSESHLYLAGRTLIPTHNSEWLNALLVNLWELHHWRSIIFTPESYPTENYMVKLAQLATGTCYDPEIREKWAQAGFPSDPMTPDLLDAAVDDLQDGFTFISPEIEGRGHDVDGLLKIARQEIYRTGAKVLALDPWNAIEHHVPGGVQKTDYIGECLMKLQGFARHHQIYLPIVAHPTKLNREPEEVTLPNGKKKRIMIEPVPNPYDVADSANWYNKADDFVTIWRDKHARYHDADPHLNSIIVHKKKISWSGEPGTVQFRWDPPTGRFLELDDDGRTALQAIDDALGDDW